jgi:hypothetical protein
VLKHNRPNTNMRQTCRLLLKFLYQTSPVLKKRNAAEY